MVNVASVIQLKKSNYNDDDDNPFQMYDQEKRVKGSCEDEDNTLRHD